MVKSLHRKVSNTKDEVFLDENYFITFIYETLESTSNFIRSNIFLSLVQHQKSRWSKMKKNQNSGHASEKFCSYLVINKDQYFHLCFIESLTFIQFSSNVYIWEEQEYCNDGDLLFYNCGCMLLEKGKECKERYEFGKKDRFLENQILSLFYLDFQLCLNEDEEYDSESSFSSIDRSIKSEEEQYLSLNRM